MNLKRIFQPFYLLQPLLNHLLNIYKLYTCMYSDRSIHTNTLDLLSHIAIDVKYKRSKYHVLIGWLLWSSLPVFVRDVCQNAVDTEVRPVSKHSLTVGAVF